MTIQNGEDEEEEETASGSIGNTASNTKRNEEEDLEKALISALQTLERETADSHRISKRDISDIDLERLKDLLEMEKNDGGIDKLVGGLKDLNKRFNLFDGKTMGMYELTICLSTILVLHPITQAV